MDNIASIRALEERAFNAWPAHKTVFCDGWIFRLSNGLTKRANSINALDPTGPFATLKQTAEQLYARHALPPVFRLSPLAPPEADAALAAAGYKVLDSSRVLIAPLSGIECDGAVSIESTPSVTWRDGFVAANAIEPAKRITHDAIIATIANPTAFATLRQNGEAIGFGLAVFERGAIGLFDIVVATGQRGQGKGRALTSALLAWGSRIGADSAYLQVRDANVKALKFYASLGFREAYRYHYRAPS